MKKRVILFGALGIVALLASQADAAKKVDEPKFKVVEDHGPIQIREYEPMVIAEVELSGSAHEVLDRGFRILADYIFGKNEPRSRYEDALDSPVRAQLKGDKIPMTAPVTAQSTGSVWKISFIMPPGRSLKNLPRPTDERIELIEIPARRVAALRFSGLGAEDTMGKKTKELRDFLDRFHFKTEGEPVYAYFNPPWVLPFLRRNEVQITVTN